MQWLQVLIVTLGWVKDFLWILLCQRSPPRGLQGIDLYCASWQLPHQFGKGILSGLDIAAVPYGATWELTWLISVLCFSNCVDLKVVIKKVFLVPLDEAAELVRRTCRLYPGTGFQLLTGQEIRGLNK